MKRNNLLIIASVAVLLVIVAAAFTFTNAETENDDIEAYEGLDQDPVYFDRIEHITHDIDLPKKLSFAGEQVPMDLFYVNEQLERELLVNSYLHANTLLLLKRTTRWLPTIDSILKANGVPSDFKYLAMIESNLTNAVSPSKAVGFWQFLQTTGQEYGLEITDEIDMRYNVELETEAACRYFKNAYSKFGSWTLAAAAFNAGSGKISRTINEQKVTSYYDMLLPQETERYVFRILALKLITENPEKYGFEISSHLKYKPYQYKTLTVSESIPDMTEFAFGQGTNYRMLKYFNPWLRSNTLTIAEGDSYTIKIPTGRYAMTHAKLKREK